MRIALDYDGTYTRDPTLWCAFIRMARDHGHEVVCVTQRFADDPEECIADFPGEVIYSNRQAKALAMAERMPDIWIDNEPHRIFASA